MPFLQICMSKHKYYWLITTWDGIAYCCLKHIWFCHLTPYLHLRKYLIICKSKKKCSEQILVHVLAEIDNTCHQSFSVKLCQKTSCLLQFAICFTIFQNTVCCCLFPYSTAFILCSNLLTYLLKIEFQSVWSLNKADVDSYPSMF